MAQTKRLCYIRYNNPENFGSDDSTQLQFQLLRKPDMKHNHIKTIPKIVVRDAGTEQLARAFTELTTGKIEVNQVCFPRLRLAPHPETD